MNPKKIVFTVVCVFGAVMLCEKLWALESALIQSVKTISAGGGIYEVAVQIEERTALLRVNRETTVLLRLPADQIVPGDRVWINQNVTPVKGINASIPMAAGASKWFGVPRVQRVARVNAFQKVPEKNSEKSSTGVLDGASSSIEMVQSVDRGKSGGLTLVMKGGVKKRFYLQGARLWKVVSSRGLKPGMTVQLNLGENNTVKQLLVGAV